MSSDACDYCGEYFKDFASYASVGICDYDTELHCEGCCDDNHAPLYQRKELDHDN